MRGGGNGPAKPRQPTHCAQGANSNSANWEIRRLGFRAASYRSGFLNAKLQLKEDI